MLELSLREAAHLGHNYIGTEHILLGLIREGEGIAAEVLQQLGINLRTARTEVVRLLSGYWGTHPPRKFSQREREVLYLVWKGLTLPEIAPSLVVDEETIRKHLATIRTKLELIEASGEDEGGV